MKRTIGKMTMAVVPFLGLTAIANAQQVAPPPPRGNTGNVQTPPAQPDAGTPPAPVVAPNVPNAARLAPAPLRNGVPVNRNGVAPPK